jgi:hypothetical protein
VRLRSAILPVVLLAAVASGCGSQRARHGPIRLEKLRNAPYTYYYVGRSFEGLELTYADSTSKHRAAFVYGTCDAGGGLFREGGCAPPLEIENKACPVDTMVVTLYGDGHGRAARAAKALRRLNENVSPSLDLRIAFDRSPSC